MRISENKKIRSASWRMTEKKKILMILLAILLLLLISLMIRNCDFAEKQKTPKISIGPSGLSESQPAVAGGVADLKVMINTKDVTINAAEVFLNYDPQAIEIISQAKESSILKIWINEETKFSNSEGFFSFVGGLPTPGFKGTGEIGTIRVKLLKSGKTTISFSDQTKLYLNDGKGTEITAQLPPMQLIIK